MKSSRLVLRLDLSMSVTHLTARQVRVTSLDYLIKALDSYTRTACCGLQLWKVNNEFKSSVYCMG